MDYLVIFFNFKGVVTQMDKSQNKKNIFILIKKNDTYVQNDINMLTDKLNTP